MNGETREPTTVEEPEHHYLTDLADFRGFYPEGSKPATVTIPGDDAEIKVHQIDTYDKTGEIGLHVALSEYRGHNFEFLSAGEEQMLYIPNGTVFDARLSRVQFEHEMVTLWYEVLGE